MNRLAQICCTLCCTLLSFSAFAQFSADDVTIVITNETAINTEQLEYSPAFYEDGIVFISTRVSANKFKVEDRRIGKNTMSTFIARRTDEGPLNDAQPFAINLMTAYHEGPLTFDQIAEKMYFSRNNFHKGKKVKAKDGEVKLQVYAADISGGKFTNEAGLSFNSKDHNYCHPSISVESNILYFASDMPGGYGGMDIYSVKRIGDEWGSPINLGPEINSPENDVFPHIHADGTLYFASQGKGGEGGLDLFYAVQNGADWQTPVNLGIPFNSSSDDFGFIIDRDNKNGYFSSNRPGGSGEDDIYSFFVKGDIERKQNASDIAKDMNIIVLDQETGQVLEGVKINAISMEELISDNITTAEGNIVKLRPSDDNNMILELEIEESNSIVGITDKEGKLLVPLNGGKYLINITKPGFLPQQLIVNTSGPETEKIVRLEIAEGCIPIAGSLINDKTADPLNGATVTLRNLKTGEEEEITADLAGKFEYCVERDQVFELVIAQNGVIIHREQMSTANSPNGPGNPMDVIIDVPGDAIASAPGYAAGNAGNYSDSPAYNGNNSSGGYLLGSGSLPELTDGMMIQLPNIYYNFNDAAIRPDAAVSLQALAVILNRFENIEIELYSHTDSRGSSKYNQKLSQRRANKAVDYLAAQGVSRNRMKPLGKGESELRNDCYDGVNCDDYQHQYNRRTEVRISSNGSNLTFSYIDTPPDVTNKPTRTSYTPAPVVDISTDYDSDKDYQVIAGTFRQRDNARSRLEELQAIGFSEAKLIHEAKLVRVSVGEFNDIESAKELVQKLRADEINAYVKFLKEHP